MRHLFATVLMAAAMLSLSACATAPSTGTSTTAAAPKTAQDIAADAFKTACVAVPLADMAFQAVRVFATNVIDDAAITWEGVVYQGLKTRCAGPVPDISSYQAVVAEIEGDVSQVMSVVAAAKNNPPTTAAAKPAT